MSQPTDPAPPERSADTPEAPPAATTSKAARPKDPLRGSRTSGAWIGVVAAAVMLVLLVVFILHNTQSERGSYLGWDGTAPLAASLLIAAAAGMISAILAASLRILQVRRRVRRERS